MTKPSILVTCKLPASATGPLEGIINGAARSLVNVPTGKPPATPIP